MYTPEFKEAVCNALQGRNQPFRPTKRLKRRRVNYTKAGAILGVSPKTLSKWHRTYCDSPGSAFRTDSRELQKRLDRLTKEF